MLSASDWQAYWVTLRLAAVTTGLLLCLAIPLAAWLAASRNRFKPVVEALVALPMVLPPTVIGFYLLIAFAPTAWLGQLWSGLGGGRLAFSFSGLVIGSVLYSLPFVVQPLHAAFAGMDRAQLEAAQILGAGRWDRLRTIVLPQARAGLATAAVLGFAHTLGEFGVVLMIGGSIPGETKVLSVALFEHVESLDYAAAHRVALSMLVLSFIMLLALYWRLGRRALLWRTT